MSSVERVRRENLEALIAEFGTADALAAAAGSSGVYLSQIRNRKPDSKTGRPRELGSSLARRLEAACTPAKPEGWMDEDHSRQAQAGRLQQPHTAEEHAPYGAPNYVRLPLLGEAAAGPGRQIDPSAEVVRQVEVLESWVRQSLGTTPAQLRLLTARGHSMRGIIEDGDVMFVAQCTDFVDDGLYILAVGDLLRVKRLRVRITDKQLVIESTDGSAPELVPLGAVGDSVLIQGRVVGAWGLKKL